MTDHLHFFSIAAISFLIGVLACLLLGLSLLPALVRAQSAEWMREYATYVQSSSPMRVIVLDRSTAGRLVQPGSQATVAGKTLREDARLAGQGRQPMSGPGPPVAAPHQEMFQHICQQNRLLRQSVVPFP